MYVFLFSHTMAFLLRFSAKIIVILPIIFMITMAMGSSSTNQMDSNIGDDIAYEDHDDLLPVANGNNNRRPKRDSALQYPTIYYICGEFPNLIYTLTPCDRCRNGGRALYVQCTSAIQCTPYYPQGPTECIDGQCCTGNDLDIHYPDVTPNFDPYNNGGQGGYIQEQFEGFCPQGFRSRIRCSAMGQCPPDQTCLNGVCCRRRNDDYIEACGGQMAIAQCVAGYCQNQFVCNTANFCCQCPIGRSVGRCTRGVCPPGYRCQSNGYCCASCPDNAMPFGVCTASDSANYNPQYRNGQRQLSCPTGYTCLQGDICCKNSIIV